MPLLPSPLAYLISDASWPTLLAGTFFSACLLVLGLFLNRGGLRWQTLKDVPGPQSDSWLYGHQIQFNRQEDVGQLDFALNEQYGGAWKLDGCYGRNILMICDPKAVHHVMHTMGYAYPKTREIRAFTGLAFGRGVSWAAGETHMRHRKLMAPTFTASNLRTFYPVFRRVSGQLTQHWRDIMQERGDVSNSVINISPGLVNTTLDIIGEAVFDYHFGALDTHQVYNEFSEIFHNLWADSNLFPPPFAVAFAASWNYVPEFILDYVKYLPARQFVRFREYLTVGKRLAKDLMDNYAEDTTTKKGRDILTLLVEANNASASQDKMSEDELLSQVTTMLFAGHETTATTLTWMLYELSQHRDDQDRVRQEIVDKRAKVAANGQADFTITDLENMPFMNAVIKEALRYHPVSPWVTRVSATHDVIPLSEPIMSPSGKMISEIEIQAGQPVTVSTCAYNRVKAAWGEDGQEWNPSRHLDPALKEGQVPVGLYSNVLTFSGGPSGCIGWKFALAEMQSTLVELIENFEFAPPKENLTMLRVPIGAIMAPMVKGKFDERAQMPLTITSLR